MNTSRSPNSIDIDTSGPRFPQVRANLTAANKDVEAVIDCVWRALATSRVPASALDEYTADLASATSYDEAVFLSLDWVEVN